MCQKTKPNDAILNPVCAHYSNIVNRNAVKSSLIFPSLLLYISEQETSISNPKVEEGRTVGKYKCICTHIEIGYSTLFQMHILNLVTFY